MRGHYELSLSNGTKIPMRFCTWSLKRFCQLQGIGPSDIGEALSGSDSLDAITNLLRAAAEYPLYKEGITPSFTDLDTCDWIDDMGGIGGKKFQEVMVAEDEEINLDDLKEYEPEEYIKQKEKADKRKSKLAEINDLTSEESKTLPFTGTLEIPGINSCVLCP